MRRSPIAHHSRGSSGVSCSRALMSASACHPDIGNGLDWGGHCWERLIAAPCHKRSRPGASNAKRSPAERSPGFPVIKC